MSSALSLRWGVLLDFIIEPLNSDCPTLELSDLNEDLQAGSGLDIQRIEYYVLLNRLD